MVAVSDLTNQVFGRLTVLHRNGSRNGRAVWRCRCECGKEVYVMSKRLLGGNTQSCGCYRTDLHSQRATTHGHTNSSTYLSWRAMLQRATNPNHVAADRYQGRGITVDEKWLTFEGFLEDMGERPEGKTLDRKDNSKGYCKDNCRWATRKEQQANRRTSILIEFEGKIYTVPEMSKILGLSMNIIRRAVAEGRPVDRTLRKRNRWDIANRLMKKE